MENTLHRIKKYLDFKGINISSFEKSVDFSNGSFASQLKKNKTIGVDKLENIVKNYPDLDVYWLLTGKGKMIAKILKNELSVETEVSPNESELLKEIVESQKETIQTQRELIYALKNKLISVENMGFITAPVEFNTSMLKAEGKKEK